MVTCELCGKEVKNTQGLRGHKTFQHSVTGTSIQQSVARVATEQQVSLLENRLQKLERVTGLRDSDLLERLTDSQLPFTEQLSKQAEQVSKLSDTVSKLSEEVEATAVTKATMNTQAGEFSERVTDLREAHNRHAAVTNEHRDTFNKNFAALGSRIDKTQKTLEDLGEGLSAVRTKQASHSHDGVSLIPKLDSKLQDLGIKMLELEAAVKNAKKRVPVNRISLGS